MIGNVQFDSPPGGQTKPPFGMDLSVAYCLVACRVRVNLSRGAKSTGTCIKL